MLNSFCHVRKVKKAWLHLKIIWINFLFYFEMFIQNNMFPRIFFHIKTFSRIPFLGPDAVTRGTRTNVGIFRIRILRPTDLRHRVRNFTTIMSSKSLRGSKKWVRFKIKYVLLLENIFWNRNKRINVISQKCLFHFQEVWTMNSLVGYFLLGYSSTFAFGNLSKPLVSSIKHSFIKDYISKK